MENVGGGSMKFVTRQEIIDYYLDLLNEGELTEEQMEILKYFSNDRS